MVSTEDRIRGSLLGLAWGDVLGCPIEGWSESEIRAVYGDYTDLPATYDLVRIQNGLAGTPVDQVNRRLRRLRTLGLHSDDTQQALALVSVCLSAAGWSPQTWAEWLVAGRQAHAWRGYGRNFDSAVAHLKRGISPWRSGARSAGIGAAMRAGPVGAIYRDDPTGLAIAVIESSLMTHADLRAAVVAYTVAHTVSLLACGMEAADVRSTLGADVESTELEWIEGHVEWDAYRPEQPVIAASVRWLATSAYSELASLRQGIVDNASRYLDLGRRTAHPSEGFALLGGMHGLFMGLWPGDDPGAILSEVMRCGGDTDTVGAICGAILGARFGTSWIPIGRLFDRDRLVSYSDALVGRVGAPEDLPAFLRREVELTRRDVAFQDAIRQESRPG